MNLFASHSRLESRAERIQDPIERLRYLRRKTLTLSPHRKYRVVLSAIALCSILSLVAWSHIRTSPSTSFKRRAAAIIPPKSGAEIQTRVWLVEQSDSSETYSNGLRVDSSFEVANLPRGRFRVFPRDHPDAAHAQWKDIPAGIVFHTTESNLAPFASDQNRKLQQIGKGVLAYIRENRSYHFVIDRFGRVFRIVRESDIAYHAGPSTWADRQFVYLNLNTSFLGVAFETQTNAGDVSTATPAQIDAARILTEMLASRYFIAAVDCVTHAQVSLNPANWLIGYHTDWAGKFPFTEIGLKDNYLEPPAGIWAFGFDYDPRYVSSTGARLLPGLELATRQLNVQATALKLTLNNYRAYLRQNYREMTIAAGAREPVKETDHEQYP